MSTNFTLEQLEQVNLGEKNGLTKKQVKTYAKRIFNPNQMREIRLGFEHKLTDNQIETYAKSNFSDSQMREIRLGYERKLTDEQVILYAKVHIKDTMMRAVRLELQAGLTFEQEKKFFTYDFTSYSNWVIEKNFRLLMKCIRKGLKRSQINKIIKMCESRRYWDDTCVFLENDKLEIALKGILADFTMKEVGLYAHSSLSVEQSKQVYLGLVKGLSVEEVRCYAHHSISADRMRRIRKNILKRRR